MGTAPQGQAPQGKAPQGKGSHASGPHAGGVEASAGPRPTRGGRALDDPDRVTAPDIPDDVPLAFEELPADFWGDEGLGAGPATGAHGGIDPSATKGPPPPDVGAGSGTRADRTEPRPGTGTPTRRRPPAGDPPAGLGRALLGDEGDDALRDTVGALQELFPGRVLEVVARADPAEDAEEGPNEGVDEGDVSTEGADTTGARVPGDVGSGTRSHPHGRHPDDPRRDRDDDTPA